MAEVIGVVASVLTLCKVVGGGIALARSLSHVGAEVKTLEEQLQNLQTILRTVDAAGNASEQPILAGPLIRLRTCMQEFHTLLATKLLRQSRGTTKVRRTAWLRHKGRISALSESLKSAHEGLHLTLTTAILLSTRGITSALVQSQQLRAIRQSNSVDEQLMIGVSSSQQLQLCETDIMSANSANSAVLPWESRDSPRRPSLVLALRPMGCELDRVTEEIDEVASSSTSASRVSESAAARSAVIKSPTPSGQSLAPWNGLNTLPAEAYTMADFTPKLIGHCEYETSTTAFSRTNRYGIYYTKSPRHWVRLQLSLTISIESRFWLAGQTSPGGKHKFKRRFHGLPEILLSRIQEFLAAQKRGGQDVFLDVYVGGRGFSSPTICQKKPAFDAGLYLKKKWERLFHMGCPYYRESEVAQRPIKTPSNNRDFLANVNSQWVFEHRFGSEKRQIKATLNVLKILRRLAGTPGIRPFIGVVLDDKDGIMKSYLTELPAGGRIARHLGPHVSWARKEKWCRQFVEAVVAVHAIGAVIGKHGSLLVNWVELDAADNIVISRFSKTFRQNPGCNGLVPPEHRDPIADGRYVKASPASDVYHMGVALFTIVAGIANSDPLELCKALNGGDIVGSVCHGHCDGPLPLPVADLPGIPEYLERVITACVSEREVRPAAWQMLNEFPPVSPRSEAEMAQEKLSLTQITTGNQWRSATSRPMRNFCSCCREMTVSSRFFHCGICCYNFYDLCPACFDAGAHCKDNSHFLKEHWKGRPEMGKMYSCVKDSGVREVLDLDE